MTNHTTRKAIEDAIAICNEAIDNGTFIYEPDITFIRTTLRALQNVKMRSADDYYKEERNHKLLYHWDDERKFIAFVKKVQQEAFYAGLMAQPDASKWKNFDEFVDKLVKLGVSPDQANNYCEKFISQAWEEQAEMRHRFGCVLEHATGGRMSKTSYATETMYAEIDDYIQSERDEAYQEGKLESQPCAMAIRDRALEER